MNTTNTTKIPEGFKSGYTAISGAPNAGKSTFLNQVLGEKISITSKKPQTTRNRILGIAHRPLSQIIFIDTPGVHKAKDPLNINIVEQALNTIGDADIILLLADISRPDVSSEKYLVEKLKKINVPVILALNKIDRVKKSVIHDVMDTWSKLYPFDTILPISAKHGTNTEQLINTMENLLPKGPPLFPEDMLTDLPVRFFAGEMIREKVFRLTGQEIPYSTAVTVDTFSKEKNGSLVKIHATIHVERNSQKGIIIGKGGSKLKSIGEDARIEIEKMVGARVFLKLFVRVQKNWSSDTKSLRRFGYR